jgi:hypothetical protein
MLNVTSDKHVVHLFANLTHEYAFMYDLRKSEDMLVYHQFS